MCEECERLKSCIYAVVSALVNGKSDSALLLARVGMYGGNVNNPLDCADPKRHRHAVGRLPCGCVPGLCQCIDTPEKRYKQATE